MVNNMTDLTAQEPAWQTRDHLDDPVIGELRNRFGPDAFTVQATRTGVPVVWIKREQLLEVGDFLKKLPKPYVMLFDLHGMDERLRTHREGLPAADFSVFYHLISIDRNRDIMLKVALAENDLHVPTFTKLFPNANWYERETWDLFGITFDGHPNLRRIMMPQTWKGHPLRKDHPARATEFLPFELTKAKTGSGDGSPDLQPEEWGMSVAPKMRTSCSSTSVATRLRTVLSVSFCSLMAKRLSTAYQTSVTTTVVRRKWGERQSWHSYIPYTDRIEYLGGCVNEMPYVLAVEKLAGITVPDRVNVIRVMLSELFRINSHLLYISTFIQDVGAMTPVFFAFTDRQKIYDLVEAITGFRMHPAWFRIGGVAHDLPRGWDRLLREFLDWMPKRLASYEKAALQNTILKGRSQGVAAYGAKEALEWGTTGAGLRATGIDFDVRKARPYSGYENFDFEIPVGGGVSDCYTRVMLKVEELRQSLRILEQCLNNMPEGPFKADHPLTTPPPKERTLQHIETLITHFLQVSWGPVMPANESFQMVEATKGINSYYLTSDGSTMSYRTRIRTPSYAHLQQIPAAIRGSLVSDLIVYLGSIDFVMSDVDR